MIAIRLLDSADDVFREDRFDFAINSELDNLGKECTGRRSSSALQRLLFSMRRIARPRYRDIKPSIVMTEKPCWRLLYSNRGKELRSVAKNFQLSPTG